MSAPASRHALRVNPRLQTLVVSAAHGRGHAGFLCLDRGRGPACRRRPTRPAQGARERSAHANEPQRRSPPGRKGCVAARCAAPAVQRGPAFVRSSNAPGATATVSPASWRKRWPGRAVRDREGREWRPTCSSRPMEREAPPLGRIAAVEVEPIAPTGEVGFSILDSVRRTHADNASCRTRRPAMTVSTNLFDAGSRFHLYPFVNLHQLWATADRQPPTALRPRTAPRWQRLPCVPDLRPLPIAIR